MLYASGVRISSRLADAICRVIKCVPEVQKVFSTPVVFITGTRIARSGIVFSSSSSTLQRRYTPTPESYTSAHRLNECIRDFFDPRASVSRSEVSDALVKRLRIYQRYVYSISWTLYAFGPTDVAYKYIISCSTYNTHKLFNDLWWGGGATERVCGKWPPPDRSIPHLSTRSRIEYNAFASYANRFIPYIFI